MKEVGEAATVTDDDKIVARFVVNALQVDPACTGDFVLPAENGHLVSLNISAETDPALANAVVPSFSLQYGWKVIADNGTTFNGNLHTAASFSCLDDVEQFPSRMGPGERATGSIVLDVPTPTGVLINELSIVHGGWEWEYPAK